MFMDAKGFNKYRRNKMKKHLVVYGEGGIGKSFHLDKLEELVTNLVDYDGEVEIYDGWDGQDEPELDNSLLVLTCSHEDLSTTVKHEYLEDEEQFKFIHFYNAMEMYYSFKMDKLK
jgi:hypothetical protein